MWFVRTLVGMVIAVIVAGLSGNAEAMLFSIVCTAGLGLVIWIPIWFAIGWVVTGGWRAPDPGSEAAHDAPGPRWAPVLGGPPATIDAEATRALEQYLRNAREQGRSDAEIRNILLLAGWPLAGVDALLDPNRPAGPEGGLWLR